MTPPLPSHLYVISGFDEHTPIRSVFPPLPRNFFACFLVVIFSFSSPELQGFHPLFFPPQHQTWSVYFFFFPSLRITPNSAFILKPVLKRIFLDRRPPRGSFLQFFPSPPPQPPNFVPFFTRTHVYRPPLLFSTPGLLFVSPFSLPHTCSLPNPGMG